MSHKKFTIEEAEAMIERNGGEIQYTKSNDVKKTNCWILGKNFGLKVLAAVDFLKNYCGYKQYKNIEEFHTIFRRVIILKKKELV